MTDLERFQIPRGYDDEAAAAAILGRLRPYAESTTTVAVRVTYWREDADLPLTSVIYASHSMHRVLPNAPLDATYLTIEAAA